MWLIPAFEPGFWNAWILFVPIIIISVFSPRILGKRGSEEASSATKRMETANNLYTLILFLSYAYSLFVPLKLNSVWLVLGLLVYLPAMFFLLSGLQNFAAAPEDKLVTKGVYSISRNPMYFAFFLVNISVGIACLSWVFPLMAVVNFLFLRYYVVSVEEPFLTAKYGDAYREYVNRTPRWIGIPRSEKKE